MMNYSKIVFITIVILATVGDSLATLTAQKFPASTDDLTFSQKMKLYTDGFIPYRDSIVYHGITIEAPTTKPTQTSIQGTVAPENTYIAPHDTVPSNSNSEYRAQPDAPYSYNNPDEYIPYQPQSHPNSSTDTSRNKCFTPDTSDSMKRFVPPRVTNAPAYWWIGDSRFVGMYLNGIIGHQDNEGVIAYTAQGHKWLTSSPSPSGIKLLETCLRDGDVVILNLGANDITNYNTYISTYTKLMSQHPNVTFKILSVNPVYDNNTQNLKNSQIETFNKALKNAFPRNYVDTYSIIKSMVTAGTTDSAGLHYHGENIEQTIYNTVMSSANEN